MLPVSHQLTELINSLVEAYPTGLPDGIQININFNLPLDTAKQAEENIIVQTQPVRIPAVQVEAPPIQSYKGPFLGLYRVIASNPSRRIKIRSDFDPTAPEASIRLTDPQYNFLKALNGERFSYLESSGYLYAPKTDPNVILYKQFGFDGQLIIIAETKTIGASTLGRVIGIGNNPYLSDPKPLNQGVTNNKNTPWLVHLIPDMLVYVPIFTADDTPGWVNMQDVEKIR